MRERPRKGEERVRFDMAPYTNGPEKYAGGNLDLAINSTVFDTVSPTATSITRLLCGEGKQETVYMMHGKSSGKDLDYVPMPTKLGVG